MEALTLNRPSGDRSLMECQKMGRADATHHLRFAFHHHENF
jgi:hypothetical protein